MRDSRFDKTEHRVLKRLVGMAYERELGAALRELKGHFTTWESGRGTSLDVTDEIHRFHNIVARELWVRYQTRVPPAFLVVSALERGILAADEIPDSIRDKLTAGRPVHDAS